MSARQVLTQARGAHVLVTGATGYVAGRLIERLLAAGANIHAAVRDPSDTAKIAHLIEMAAAGSISFFKGNLLEPGSYDQAMQGCSVVFHTASPFLAKVDDPQKDLVDPALKGTINVLDSVNRTESVTRVVLTSSAATMAGGPADMAKTGGVVGEESWNTASSIENGAYLYAKTVAEQTAWQIADAQQRWRLVVINPGLVLGPGLGAGPTSASFDRVRSLGDGTFRDAVPPMRFGMVDVRDVAEAHFRAGFDPAAEGRHLVVEDAYSLGDIAQLLKAHFGDLWPFPRYTELPKDFPRYRWDNSKSKDALGLVYRPVGASVIAMFQQLIDTGQLTPSGFTT